MPTSPSRYATSAILRELFAGPVLFLRHRGLPQRQHFCRADDLAANPGLNRCTLGLHTRAFGRPSRGFASAGVEQRHETR